MARGRECIECAERRMSNAVRAVNTGYPGQEQDSI